MPRPLLFCLLGLLLAAAVLAAIRDEGVVSLLVLAALAAVIAAWRLARAAKGKPTVPTCSFCGKTHQQVRKLVAGPNCMICDECVGLSKEIIIEQDGNLGTASQVAASELERVLAHRGFVGPEIVQLAFAESDRIVRAWLMLDPSAASCRRACTAARRVENLHAALLALTSVPADERTASDELDCAALNLTEGELDEAQERLEAIAARNDLSEIEEAVLALHEATLDGLDPQTSDEGLRESCALAQDAMATLDEHEAGLSRDALLAEGHRARARALVRLGQSSAALDEARAALVLLASAQNQAVLAEALEASGDDEGAAEARREALGLAHPESLVARQLTPTSEGPFR